MTKQITLEEALELVTFHQNDEGAWCVSDVFDDVHGDVYGKVVGDVEGDVISDVKGTVYGTINGREWQFVETPKDKLRRLIVENADKEQLLETLDQLEDNND